MSEFILKSNNNNKNEGNLKLCKFSPEYEFFSSHFSHKLKSLHKEHLYLHPIIGSWPHLLHLITLCIVFIKENNFTKIRKEELKENNINEKNFDDK